MASQRRPRRSGADRSRWATHDGFQLWMSRPPARGCSNRAVAKPKQTCGVAKTKPFGYRSRYPPRDRSPTLIVWVGTKHRVQPQAGWLPQFAIIAPVRQNAAVVTARWNANLFPLRWRG